MYIPLRILKRDVIKREDQSEDSPFGTPQPSQYDDPVNPNNETPASTSLDLPAVPRSSVPPTDTLSTGIDPQLTLFPTKGLDQGAVIGIAVAVVAILILALGILDIFILPSGVRRAFSRKPPTDPKTEETSSSPSPPPTPPPQKSLLAKSKPKPKPLPTVPAPTYFSRDIRPSFRRNSFSSGYSSRYSRTMSFDSGVGMHFSSAAAAKDVGLAIPKPGYARSIASTVGWRPWDDDSRSEITGFKNSAPAAAYAYNGPIRPGMGVGRWE